MFHSGYMLCMALYSANRPTPLSSLAFFFDRLVGWFMSPSLLSSVVISRWSKFFSAGMINNKANTFLCTYSLFNSLTILSFHHSLQPKWGRGSKNKINHSAPRVDYFSSTSRTVLVTWSKPSMRTVILNWPWIYSTSTIFFLHIWWLRT